MTFKQHSYMVLTIYDKYGTARTDISPGDGSTQQKEVQGDNVLTLSFTHYEHIPLDVNDYVDFEGERYWLTEKYAPAQKSDGEWSYDVKFYGIESLIKRFLVLETTDNNAEPVFTLTATPREHVAMVVKCINNGMGHTTDWKVGQVDGTDLIVIDYEGKYCDEALKEIAEKVGGSAEWWVEGQTVNICRCEHGEEIILGYGNGLTSLERDTDNTNKFYTRLFPIGSTRNIDAEKYGHSRLMLPGGRRYVELHTDEYGIYDHYEKDAFSGIYPRRTGEVSSVRSENVKDDDGNAFTIYYFRDDTLNFDPNDYELAGETKRVSFQDGELAGLGTDDDHYFEVNFDSKTREFEIITIWPYDDDTQLPGGKLAVGFLIRLVVAPAEAVQNHQIFEFCQPCGFQYGKHAGNVHRHGFFRINMFAGVNGHRQMFRTESGGSAEQNYVNIRLQQSLVTVQAAEQAAPVQPGSVAVLFRQ